MPVPTLRPKTQFVSSQTLLPSGGNGVPRVPCWSQCHQGMRQLLAGPGEGGLLGLFWHIHYWPLPPLPGNDVRCGQVGSKFNARLHQPQLQWEWSVWKRKKKTQHEPCLSFFSFFFFFSFSFFFFFCNSIRVRVVWGHWYWQHVTTLSDVSCEIVGTDTSQLFQTCGVRSSVLTTRHTTTRQTRDILHWFTDHQHDVLMYWLTHHHHDVLMYWFTDHQHVVLIYRLTDHQHDACLSMA